MTKQTMYGTPIIYGTIQDLSHDTTLGDIYQTILIYNKFQLWGGKRLPFSYENIAGLIEQYCIQLQIQPVAHKPEEYCTHATEYNERTWQLVFDLQLHDAAVTYTSFNNMDKLTKEDNRHGFKLWCWSRQLRQDVARDETEKYTLGVVKDGLKLKPGELLLAYLRSLRWYGRTRLYWPVKSWLHNHRKAKGAT